MKVLFDLNRSKAREEGQDAFVTEFEYTEDTDTNTEIVFCWTDQECLNFDWISHSIVEREMVDKFHSDRV